MKTLKNLVKTEKLNIEELMMIKGAAEKAPVGCSESLACKSGACTATACPTSACATSACSSGSCSGRTCGSVGCNSAMDGSIIK